jgi:hypothetical protein
MTTNKALIDLPKEEMMMFFTKHNAYQNTSESERAEMLLDLLTYTYTKCGYKLTKALIDKEMVDNPSAKMLVLGAVIKRS